MTSSGRWEQVARLYHAALEKAPAERDNYLRDACGADDALRLEVQSLLDSHAEAERFLEKPALELVDRRDTASMSHSDGTDSTMTSADATIMRLRYDVVRRLGAGGMGVVYEA